MSVTEEWNSAARPLPAEAVVASTGSSLESTTVVCDGKHFEVFHFDAQDHIFRLLQDSHTFYELDFLSAIRRYLSDGDFVLDVGANVGNHTLFFAGVLGCRVAAFEPEPQALSLLQRNVATNGLAEQVAIWPFAAAASAGRFSAELSAPVHNLGAVKLRPDAQGVIRAVRLDEIEFKLPVKLIKIDVEGMELDVLRGAEILCTRDRPVICLECDEVDRLEPIVDYMEQLGFLIAESHNYTATHVFTWIDQPSALEASLSRRLAFDYVLHGHEIDELQHRLNDASTEVKRLTAKVDYLTRPTRNGGPSG